MALIFGRVAAPDIEDDIIDYQARDQGGDCRGYDMLGWRPDPPEFLVLHGSQGNPGTTLGSPGGYFTIRCVGALTDLEVDSSPKARFRRFVERGNAPSGWANGRVSAPYGDALKYLEQHDWDYGRVNRMGESIEIIKWFAQPGSSNPTRDDPVSPETQEKLAQWMAWRGDQYKIPWADFPIIKAEGGRSYITWHQEWTIGTGKVCPGAVVMGLTPAIIARAAQIMEAAQDQPDVAPSPKPPAYATPELPEWWSRVMTHRLPSDAKVDGVTWYAVRRRMEALRNANRYSRPDTSSPKSGPKVMVREKVQVERYFTDAENKKWLVEDGGHYLPATAFAPRLSIKAA